MQLFDLTHPEGPTTFLKIKSQIWGIFYSRYPPQNQILRTFCFIQPFDKTQPRGPIWEFGGSSEWNKAFQSILNLLPMILDIGGLRAVDFLGGSPFTCKVSARQPEAACRSSPCTDLHKHSLASIAQGVGGYGLKHMSWPFQGECGLPCQISAPGVKWCGCLFQTNTHACTHTDSYLFYIDNTMQTQMFERSSLTKIVDTNYMVCEPKWRNCFEEIFGTPIFVPLESHFHFQYFF